MAVELPFHPFSDLGQPLPRVLMQKTFSILSSRTLVCFAIAEEKSTKDLRKNHVGVMVSKHSSGEKNWCRKRFCTTTLLDFIQKALVSFLKTKRAHGRFPRAIVKLFSSTAVTLVSLARRAGGSVTSIFPTHLRPPFAYVEHNSCL